MYEQMMVKEFKRIGTYCPPKLHKDFKKAVIDKDETMQEVLLRCIEEYVKNWKDSLTK